MCVCVCLCVCVYVCMYVCDDAVYMCVSVSVCVWGGGGGAAPQGLEFGFPCFFSIGIAYADKQFDIAMHTQL